MKEPFRSGDLLYILKRTEERLPDLLREPLDTWSTLDIDYEAPRVERLWRQIGPTTRLYLHRIHPCQSALYHPHPWPSAIRILTGRYEMGMGYLTPDLHERKLPVIEVGRLSLGPGDRYEMIDKCGWHYVKPVGGPSLSLMVTETPWDKLWPSSEFGQETRHRQLQDAAKKDLHAEIVRTFTP